jgi:hypothetical protein
MRGGCMISAARRAAIRYRTAISDRIEDMMRPHSHQRLRALATERRTLEWALAVVEIEHARDSARRARMPAGARGEIDAGIEPCGAHEQARTLPAPRLALDVVTRAGEPAP